MHAGEVTPARALNYTAVEDAWLETEAILLVLRRVSLGCRTQDPEGLSSEQSLEPTGLT